MGIKLANNAGTTLASSISAGASTLVVSAGGGVPYPVLDGVNGNYTVLTLEDASGNREFIRANYRSGDAFGSVAYPLQRGYWGSAARSWAAGDVVDSRASKDVFETILAEAGSVTTSALSAHTAAADPHPGYQLEDATLMGLAAVAVAGADKLIYSTGPDAFAATDLTDAARQLLDDADADAMRATLAAAKSGANTDLTAITGLTAPLAAAQGGVGKVAQDLLDDTGEALTSVAGANTITAACVAGLASYVTGQRFTFTASETNAGAVTINITPAGGSALGAKAVQKNGLALVAGDLVAASTYRIRYDGTQFQLVPAAADGDMLVRRNDAWVALPKGTTGQALLMGATFPQWGEIGLHAMTAQAATSGTKIDFPGIPAGTKRITVLMMGVSTSGSSPLQIRLGKTGDAEGVFEATGYDSKVFEYNSGSITSSTTGFILDQGNLAARTKNGTFEIMRLTGDQWVGSGTGMTTTAGVMPAAGSKTLGGELDRVQITTVNGTDTFDAGTINVLYE